MMMIHLFMLIASCILTITVSAKPAELPATARNTTCSSEGLTCSTEGEKCCDGLSCLVSGDDRVRRCFELLPSVEYDEV